MPRVALVMAWLPPGRHALSVLAGALQAEEDQGLVRIVFARTREAVVEEANTAARAGDLVALAWSFYSASFPRAAEDLRWVRARLEGPALAVAGGVHATAEPRQVLDAGFDLAAVGEGEVVVRELVRRLGSADESQAEARGRGAPGTAWLEAGELRSAPKPPLVALDDWPPFAARHRKFGAIEITRGCIYACRFCQTPFMSKARFRHRSIADTAAWVRVLRDAGKPDVRFITPTALSYGTDDEAPNLAAVEELLAACREAAGPQGRLFYGTFPSEIRPEHVTPEAVAMLRRYVANDNVILGGQSGSDRVLQASGRGHDREAVVRAVPICLEGGLLPNVDFIVGFPGETPDDVEATLALMRELTSRGARVHAHVFMPLPGTPWTNAAPGRLSESTRLALDRLASTGAAYGQWKEQESIAEGIAARRRTREKGVGTL